MTWEALKLVSLCYCALCPNAHNHNVDFSSSIKAGPREFSQGEKTDTMMKCLRQYCLSAALLDYETNAGFLEDPQGKKSERKKC